MIWEAQFFGNRGIKVCLLLAELGWWGALGLPLLLVSSLRVLTAMSIQGWVILSMAGCSVIYPCWTGTTCCSLLTWAEMKWFRQLIIQGAIISSINMRITGISRGIDECKLVSRVRLCNPMDCRVRGILQARILEWVAFPFSRGSSQPRDRPQVSLWEGNRQEGQGSPGGERRLQVPDIFITLKWQKETNQQYVLFSVQI